MNVMTTSSIYFDPNVSLIACLSRRVAELIFGPVMLMPYVITCSARVCHVLLPRFGHPHVPVPLHTDSAYCPADSPGIVCARSRCCCTVSALCVLAPTPCCSPTHRHAQASHCRDRVAPAGHGLRVSFHGDIVASPLRGCSAIPRHYSTSRTAGLSGPRTGAQIQSTTIVEPELGVAHHTPSVVMRGSLMNLPAL
jgi:hypothetical protein